MTQQNPAPPAPNDPPVDDPNKQSDPPAEDQKAKQDPPSDPPADDVVEIKSIVKDAEGNFVFIVDPSDPKSTVYKGTSIDELLSNASKGIKEKDAYINKLKEDGQIAPSKPKRDELRSSKEPEAPVYPEYGQFLQKAMKELGVDEKLLQYTDDDWKQVEETLGVRKALQLENKVQRAKQVADQQYAEANVKAINDSTLDEETEAVEDILKEYGIKEEDFEDAFDKVLKAVYADPNNFSKTGVRKNGKIVAAATKIAKAMADGTTKAAMKKQIEEEIAKDRSIKASIKQDGPTSAPFHKADSKAPVSTEAAMEEILRDIRAKK